MTLKNVFTFDGKNFKAATGQAGLNDAYFASWLEAGQPGGPNSAIVGGMSPLRAYQTVPWLFRAVTQKASLTSRMPFALMRGNEEVTDAPELASLMKGFRKNLFMLKASLMISGAAYLYLETNTLGHNITPRFLRPMFVRPRIAPGLGLTGFDFTDPYAPDLPRQLPLDRIVYFWNPNFSSSVMPGPGEATVALSAASMLWALDAFTAGFFNSGGVEITVFEIPQSTPKEDRENFQNFLNRALSGVRNAFRNIAVRGGVKPTVIGSKIKDTEAPELTDKQRQSVAVAIGVPPPVISGEHQNKATAQVTMLTFYTDYVIPETEALFEEFNDQLFHPLGLELIARPQELEVMQDAQLTQAEAIEKVVGAPVLTVDEGRDLLGYEPLSAAPDEGEGSDMSDNPAIAALTTWRRLALDAVRAGKSADVPVPDEIPLEFMHRLDAELKTAASTAEVRAIFERAWPRPTARPGSLARLGQERRRAGNARAAKTVRPRPSETAELAEALHEAAVALREAGEGRRDDPGRAA